MHQISKMDKYMKCNFAPILSNPSEFEIFVEIR